jgi:tRNA pseudouridine32 synthase/23S rRNA pseudouridine746 synthase
VLAIIHRDDRILVLCKPAGLLSVPGIGPQNQECLALRAAAEVPGARVVHRLDRETSGVIVMALDAEAQRDLGRQFERRTVRKRYVAVVAGEVAPGQGRIDLPLRKDLDHPPRHMIDRARGRPALTRFRVTERAGGRTRLLLRPLTGRSHQIRVHLAAIGHPILGDELYAPPPVAAAARRLLLHAQSISIAHPSSGRRLTFSSDCPF